MRFRHLLLAALALPLLIPSALAQDLTASDEVVAEAPTRFTYSGLLTNAEGAMLADGPRRLVFRGYASAEDARQGGAATWEETHEAAVVSGRFLTVLGSQDDVPADVHYLTISVDGEPASAPVRLGREVASSGAAFAPGNTLQDSYDNGRVIDVAPGSPMQIRGAAGDLGLTIRDITPVFITQDLMRFRMRSVSGGRTWEYRVYPGSSLDPGPGVFAITDATGGGADGFVMKPGVSESLLVLDGNTVNVGGPAAARQFRAYTTANPVDPEAGVANYLLSDDAGDGSKSTWYTETGTIHTLIEADGGGEGGFFTIVNGTGGAAFEVNGNNVGGSRTRIGTGANGSSFNDALSASASVALPTDAIEASEMLDEAGAANATNPNSVTVTSGVNVTLSRSITVPAAGYVLAIGTAELILTHTMGATSTIQYSVSRDCDASPTAPGTQQTNLTLPGGACTGTYRIPGTVQGLFTVAAGTTTFCNFLSFAGAASPSIDDQNLTLLYVPTAYGTVETNLQEGAGEETRAAAQAALTSGDIAAERAASILANDARLAAELSEIQVRLTEIQSELDSDGIDR